MKTKPRRKMLRRTYIAELERRVRLSAASLAVGMAEEGIVGPDTGEELSDLAVANVMGFAEDLAKWCVRLRSQRRVAERRGMDEYVFVEDGSMDVYYTLSGGVRA